MKFQMLILFFLLFVSSANGASFDCKKASTPIERTICKNDYLSKFDDNLSFYYTQLKSSLTSKEFTELRSQQRQWLKLRNTDCKAAPNQASCLGKMYRSRVDMLKTLLESPRLPELDALKSICNHIAELNPKERFPFGYQLTNTSTMVQLDRIDSNNDGIYEKLEKCRGGTMGVDCISYIQSDGTVLQSNKVNHEWRTYWAYGQKLFGISDKWFHLYAYDNLFTKPAYVSYTTPLNNEYVVCEFENNEQTGTTRVKTIGLPPINKTSFINKTVRPKLENEPSESVIDVTGFAKAKTTWASNFNPTKKVPDVGFHAYYFNTNDPRRLVFSEIVDDISINYAYDEFHGIDSKDFGGFWIGKLSVDKPGIKTFSLALGHAKVRVIINGFVIFEGRSDRELTIQLDQGDHLIEVEYVNNWHTTDFSARLSDFTPVYSLHQIKQTLDYLNIHDFDFYYVGLYDSAAKDLTVDVALTNIEEPIVLVLSSYGTVRWNILNKYEVDIKAIIYGASTPGATVSGQFEHETNIFKTKKQIGGYASSINCSCHGSRPHCEGSSMLDIKRKLEKLGDNRLTGFTGTYSGKHLVVPQVVVNPEYIKKQKTMLEERDELIASCKKKTDPDFEKMFSK